MTTLKRLVSAVLACLTTFSTVSATAFAGEIYTFTDEEIDSAPVKPVITIDSKLISTKELKESDNQVEISVNVSGADMKYASTGLHICYDNRLTIAEKSSGYAIDYLNMTISSEYTPSYEYGMNEIFLATSGNKCSGMDGTMWTITFILPDDAKNNDVFPIDIAYKENSETADMFSNVTNNRDGQLMSAYTFTKGIYNGNENNFRAEPQDILKCPALAYIDESYDGYIAIADKQETTAPIKYTTTTTNTTVTSATTTTSTESSLIIVPSEVNMGIGDTNKLAIAGVQNISDVMWTSGDTHVATVDENGNVTAKNIGNTTIYAVYKGNIASCTIKVRNENINYGDANGDGQINMADVTAIVQHIGNRDEYGLDDTGLRNADVNSDGQVTGEDALIIQKFIAGMYESLPI